MAITAEFVKEITGNRADQRLYSLSEPYDVKSWADGTVERTITHVVTSAVSTYSGPETYLFAADEEGDVIDWMELPGSFRGSLDHDAAIAAFIVQAQS